jgi:hypothetical protein
MFVDSQTMVGWEGIAQFGYQPSKHFLLCARSSQVPTSVDPTKSAEICFRFAQALTKKMLN